MDDNMAELRNHFAEASIERDELLEQKLPSDRAAVKYNRKKSHITNLDEIDI